VVATEPALYFFDAGQLACKIVADVSPDGSGPVIDRLKQLGKVARLEISRKQTSVDGQSPPVPGAKVERGDTRLVISLYNIANIAPRQTTNLTIACANVEDAYAKIVERVAKATPLLREVGQCSVAGRGEPVVATGRARF
jgi:hypothetical protein